MISKQSKGSSVLVKKRKYHSHHNERIRHIAFSLILFLSLHRMHLKDTLRGGKKILINLNNSGLQFKLTLNDE